MSKDQARICPILVQTLSVVRNGRQFSSGHGTTNWGTASQPQSSYTINGGCLALAHHQELHISGPIYIFSMHR